MTSSIGDRSPMLVGGPRLVVVPSLPVARDGDKLVLTRKFISGIAEYQRRWLGPVQVVMEPASAAGDSLDNVAVGREELPFDLKVMRCDAPEMEDALRGAAMAMLTVHYRQIHLAEACARLGVRFVYGAEYSLRTRLQIARTNTRNPLRLARRALWQFGEERRIRQTLARATGVQCNGTPTYEAYRVINSRTMLFFDTRIDATLLADEAALRRRFAARRAGGRLRLAFSGRLIAMKGADHLVRVADALRRKGRSFELSICGAGALEPKMQSDVRRLGLGDLVRFKGNLDFERELVPFVRDEVDLFVCCHRQGDPSCTYLETMACCVPIAGYGNEALCCVAAAGGAGWATPMNSPSALAALVASPGEDEIERHSLRSLAFARASTPSRRSSSDGSHARWTSPASCLAARSPGRPPRRNAPVRRRDTPWPDGRDRTRSGRSHGRGGPSRITWRAAVDACNDCDQDESIGRARRPGRSAAAVRGVLRRGDAG